MIADVAILTVIFGTAFLIVAASLILAYRVRAIEHKERLVALEKGIPLPDLAKEPRVAYRHAPLRKGIILLFVGAGLGVALYLTPHVGATAAVWGGFVAFIGIGHIVWWFISIKLDPGPGGQGG
jgi:hypothetical protein